MINSFLRDLMNSVPSFWTLVSEMTLPVKERKEPIENFDEILSGTLVVIVPIQFLFASTVPFGEFGYGAAAAAVGVTILLGLAVLGGLTRLVTPPDNVTNVYQGWVVTVLTCWIATTVLLSASFLVTRLPFFESGELITGLFQKDFKIDMFGWLVILFYSVVAIVILSGLKRLASLIQSRLEANGDQKAAQSGVVSDKSGSISPYWSYAFCALFVSLLVWLNAFLLVEGQ